MGVVVGDHVATVGGLSSWAESGGDARGHPDHSQHQGHCAGEVLAVAATRAQEERAEGQVPDRCALAVAVVGGGGRVGVGGGGGGGWVGRGGPGGGGGGRAAGPRGGEPVDPAVRRLGQGAIG